LKLKFVQTIDEILQIALEDDIDRDFIEKQNKPLFRTKL
jgi:hypothetical protein